jgi:hypothetical protein
MGRSGRYLELEWVAYGGGAGGIGGSPAQKVDGKEFVGEARRWPAGWELGSGQRPQGSTNRLPELGLLGRGISFRLLEEGGATGRRRSSCGGQEVGGGWDEP